MNWINVKDRLPEKRGYVLTWHPKNKNMWMTHFHEGEFDIPMGSQQATEEMTHWMPLPEPPSRIKEVLHKILSSEVDGSYVQASGWWEEVREILKTMD